MFPTKEVRWFYRGIIPAEVLEWFRRGEREADKQPPRVDYYLRLRDTDSLGIKLREGRIEIKQRCRSLGIIRFGGQVTGLMEHWQKWSIELARVSGGLMDLLRPEASWIAVHKKRELQRYQIADSGEILAVLAEKYPEQGCALELTSIDVEGESWWSLGFEAFGGGTSLQKNLLLVVEHVLARGQVPVLDARNSYGYPKWLQVIGQMEGERARH